MAVFCWTGLEAIWAMLQSHIELMYILQPGTSECVALLTDGICSQSTLAAAPALCSWGKESQGLTVNSVENSGSLGCVTS